MVERIRAKFRVREVCVVADRGFVSEATLKALEEMDPPVRYDIGVRRRRSKEVGEVVLECRARWQEVMPERVRAKDPAPLKVREVEVEGRRYVVCLNEEERRKDAHDRAAIVESLGQALESGDKSLAGNKGFRRFLKTAGGSHFAIDERRIAADARYDGLFVLRTDTDCDADTVAHIYNTLWMVEDTFRTAKPILDTRPIYHKCDETIRSYVPCSFLALCLQREVVIRLMDNGLEAEWKEILRGLDNLHVVEATLPVARNLRKPTFHSACAIGGKSSSKWRRFPTLSKPAIHAPRAGSVSRRLAGSDGSQHCFNPLNPIACDPSGVVDLPPALEPF